MPINQHSDTLRGIKRPAMPAAVSSGYRGGISLPAIPVIQQKATKYVRFPADESDLPRYVSEVQALEPEERHELFKDASYMHVLKTSPNLDSTQKMVMVGALMEGSFKWNEAGGDTKTDFDKHFGDDDPAANPANDRKNATMNCWESILYAAHLIGLYDKKDLKVFQKAAQHQKDELLEPQEDKVSIYYNSVLSQSDIRRLKPIADGKSGQAKLSESERAALKVKVLEGITIAAAGKIVVYEQGGVSSHWALSLGGNKMMSLNGEGQSVGIFAAGDLDNLLKPAFWSNPSDIAVAQTLLKDTVEYGLAPWEDYRDEDLEAASEKEDATDTSAP